MQIRTNPNILFNKNNRVSFESLKPQKLVCEKVLKDFGNEFGHLKSSSKLFFRLQAICLKTPGIKNSSLVKHLNEKLWKLNDEIIDNYSKVFYPRKNYKSFNSLINKLKKTMLHTKKANCDEFNIVIYKKLQDQGFNPKYFKMKVQSNNNIQVCHYSTVIGLKKEAKIENPATWGSKAIIVDAWEGIVMEAHKALELFEKKLSLGKESTKIKYIEKDVLENIKTTKK